MTIKVGDMVKYQDQTVRVLQLDSGLLSGGQEIKLAGFGWLKRDNPNIELVKSIKLPRLHDGDQVIVRDIPKIEKDYYGTSWVDSMDKYVGKPYKYLIRTNLIVLVKLSLFMVGHFKFIT